MISKSKLLLLSVVTVLLLSLSLSLVGAQYTTSQTTDVTIASNGTFTGSSPAAGVSYVIQGSAGATGTVTVDAYSGNPQPTASIPSGDSLNDFLAITFNMNAANFSQATVTVSYTSGDVQNIQSPYAVFKYVASSNSYVKLLSTVDTNAKTISVTLNGISDPVLAIGGAKTASSGGGSGALWAVLIVIVIVVVLVAVFIVSRRRPWAKLDVTDTSNHPTSRMDIDFLNDSVNQKTISPPKAQSSNINAEDKPQTVIPTDQKIENQDSESANSDKAQSLILPPEPQLPEVTVEENQPASATEQNVDTSVKETPQPEPLNMNAQATPQTATPNNVEVKPQNMNVGKKTQTAASRRKKNRKRNNR
jgi:hypothetical protein